MVAVATSLSHDGIASPVSSLSHDGQKASYGVQMPVAVLVDLDYVRTSPVEMRRSGVGDAVSNLSAVADWKLAERERGEPVDGLAVALAHTGAEAVLHSEARWTTTTSWWCWARRSFSQVSRWPPRAAVARAAAPTTRSCTPSPPPSRTPDCTASWRAWARCSRLTFTGACSLPAS